MRHVEAGIVSIPCAIVGVPLVPDAWVLAQGSISRARYVTQHAVELELETIRMAWLLLHARGGVLRGMQGTQGKCCDDHTGRSWNMVGNKEAS